MDLHCTFRDLSGFGESVDDAEVSDDGRSYRWWHVDYGVKVDYGVDGRPTGYYGGSLLKKLCAGTYPSRRVATHPACGRAQRRGAHITVSTLAVKKGTLHLRVGQCVAVPFGAGIDYAWYDCPSEPGRLMLVLDEGGPVCSASMDLSPGTIGGIVVTGCGKPVTVSIAGSDARELEWCEDGGM